MESPSLIIVSLKYLLPAPEVLLAATKLVSVLKMPFTVDVSTIRENPDEGISTN